MSASKFGFEIVDGRLGWSHPRNAPDLTDEQAHTLAITHLAVAMEKLAEAIDRHAERANKE